jgi:hypothetical protein
MPQPGRIRGAAMPSGKGSWKLPKSSRKSSKSSRKGNRGR